MTIKLFDSELKVMEVLWREGELPAKQVAAMLGEAIGWNKNTTYTVIKKCIDKGAIGRIEPGFVCRALISREQVQQQEIDELVDKVFGGSQHMLFAALLERSKLPEETIEKLTQMVRDA